MAKKLSKTQQDVLDEMHRSGEPLVRLSGGFWTFPSIAKQSGYKPTTTFSNTARQSGHEPATDTYWKAAPGSTYPTWYAGIRTLRSLERRGYLRHDPNSKAPDWAVPFILVPQDEWPEPTAYKRPLPEEFTDTQKQQVLDHLREWETNYLSDPVHGFTNPFRRPGITAMEIAILLGFERGETKSGAVRYDTPRARRLLMPLVKLGAIESCFARTQQAGSKTKECFTLPGFFQRLEQAKETL